MSAITGLGDDESLRAAAAGEVGCKHRHRHAPATAYLRRRDGPLYGPLAVRFDVRSRKVKRIRLGRLEERFVWRLRQKRLRIRAT